MAQDVFGGFLPREPMGAGFQSIQFCGSFPILSLIAHIFWVPTAVILASREIARPSRKNFLYGKAFCDM